MDDEKVIEIRQAESALLFAVTAQVKEPCTKRQTQLLKVAARYVHAVLSNQEHLDSVSE